MSRNVYGHLQDIKYPQSLVQNRFQTVNDSSYHQRSHPQPTLPPRSSTTPIAAVSAKDQERTIGSSSSSNLHPEAITSKPSSVSVENMIKEILGNNDGSRITYSSNNYYQPPIFSSYSRTDSHHSVPSSLIVANISQDQLARPETAQASPLDLSLKKSAEAGPCEGLAARMDAAPLTCRNIRDPRLYIATGTYGQNSTHHMYPHPDTHDNYMQSLRRQPPHPISHHQAVVTQVTDYHHHHLPPSHQSHLAVAPGVSEMNNNEVRLERAKKRQLDQDGPREFAVKDHHHHHHHHHHQVHHPHHPHQHQHLPPPPQFVGTGISGFSHLRMHGDPSEPFVYLHRGAQFRPLQIPPPDSRHTFPVVASDVALKFHGTGRPDDFRKYSPPIVTSHYGSSRFDDSLPTYKDGQQRHVPRRPWSESEEKKEKNLRERSHHHHQFRLQDPVPDKDVEPMKIQIPPPLNSQRRQSTSCKDKPETECRISKSIKKAATTKTTTTSNDLYSPTMPVLTPNDERNSLPLGKVVSTSPATASTVFQNSRPPKLVSSKSDAAKKPNSWEEIRSKGTKKIGGISSRHIHEGKSSQMGGNIEKTDNDNTIAFMKKNSLEPSHKEHMDYRNLPSKKRSYYRNFTESDQVGIDAISQPKNGLEHHFPTDMFSKEAAMAARSESPRSSLSESDCMGGGDRDHKSNSSSREISRLRNTEGYIGDRLKTCEDLVDVDSSQLNREERALQRALLRFNEMEKRGEKSLSTKPITKKIGDSENASDTDMAWERISEINEMELTKRSFSESEATDLNSESGILQNRFKDFIPKVIQTRTRNGCRLSAETKDLPWKPLYNKDAKYEEEVEKEEQKKLIRKSLKEAAGLVETNVAAAASTPPVIVSATSTYKELNQISTEPENKQVPNDRKNDRELPKLPDQSHELPDQSHELPDQSRELPDQSRELPDQNRELPDQNKMKPSEKEENTELHDKKVTEKSVHPTKESVTDSCSKEEVPKESDTPDTPVVKKRMVGRPPKKKRLRLQLAAAKNSPVPSTPTKTNSNATRQSKPLEANQPLKTRRRVHPKEISLAKLPDDESTTGVVSEVVAADDFAGGGGPSQEAHNFSPQSSMRCIINPKNYNKIRFVNNDNSHAEENGTKSGKQPRKVTGNRPGRPLGSTSKAKCGRKRKYNKARELDNNNQDHLQPAKNQEPPVLTPQNNDDNLEELCEPAFPMPLEMKRLMVNKTSGETALHRAARLGYDTVAVYCIKTSEVDVNAKDNAGFTPLHECCVRGRLEITKLLLTYGANPNACSVDGIRPIHDAIENDHIEVVRLLLSYGADPLLATYSGRTPLKIARSKEMKILVRGYIYDLNGYIPEEESEKESEKENKETEEKQGDEVKIYWEFRGSCSLFDKEEEVGFDLFSNIPSWEEDDDADVASLEIEMSEMPHLTPYNLLIDESKRKENYNFLGDVLKSKRIRERELTERLGYPVKRVPKDVFKSQLADSQVVEPGLKDQLANGGSPSRNSFVKLVRIDQQLRRLLKVETVEVGSKRTRPPPPPPPAQGVGDGIKFPLSMPSRKMGRGRGRKKLLPVGTKNKKLDQLPSFPAAISRDKKKTAKTVTTNQGRAHKAAAPRGRPSQASKKCLSQQQQPPAKPAPTSAGKEPVRRPVGRPHRAKSGRPPHPTKQNRPDHQSVEKFIPSKPAAAATTAILGKRTAAAALPKNGLPAKKMKKQTQRVSEKTQPGPMIPRLESRSKLLPSNGSRSLRAKSTPDKKTGLPDARPVEWKKNVVSAQSRDGSNNRQPGVSTTTVVKATAVATAPTFFLDNSQSADSPNEGLGHQLLSSNYKSQLMVSPPQVSGYVC